MNGKMVQSNAKRNVLHTECTPFYVNSKEKILSIVKDHNCVSFIMLLTHTSPEERQSHVRLSTWGFAAVRLQELKKPVPRFQLAGDGLGASAAEDGEMGRQPREMLHLGMWGRSIWSSDQLSCSTRCRHKVKVQGNNSKNRREANLISLGT